MPSSTRADIADDWIYDRNTPINKIRLNQQVAPSGPTVNRITSQNLGLVAITSGTLRIVLSSNADGYVIADATRVVPSIALPSTALLNGNPIPVGGGDALELKRVGPTVVKPHAVSLIKIAKTPAMTHHTHLWNLKHQIH